MKTVAFLGKFFFCLILLTGCSEGVQPLWSQAKPETIINFNPVSKTVHLHNSKDVNIKIKKIQVKTEKGTEALVEDLEIQDSASTVRTANVEQLKAATELTKVAMEPVNKLADAVNTFAARIPLNSPTSVPSTSDNNRAALRDFIIETVKSNNSGSPK